ncbi:Glutathione-dependent formaldehyde-activating GFA [Gluconobacter oxydans H24]|nr:Glutathione-dependent formaldehyde-activating GFA [Gluconobacter oxydans H24]
MVTAAAPDGIKILQGDDVLTSYRFNTKTAQHFFCSRCGIHTHHQRRSDPNRHAVNVACLDGVSPFDFPEVPVTDGINHPNDTGKPTRLAGILRFESASEP